MKPAMFETMTHILGAPDKWDASKHGECSGLPVEVDRENMTFTSCWVPTPEEIEALVNGGRIYVTVVCNFQPPLRLDVREETKKPQPYPSENL